MPLAKTHSKKIRHGEKQSVLLGPSNATGEASDSLYFDGCADLQDGTPVENLAGGEPNIQGERMLHNRSD